MIGSSSREPLTSGRTAEIGREAAGSKHMATGRPPARLRHIRLASTLLASRLAAPSWSTPLKIARKFATGYRDATLLRDQ